MTIQVRILTALGPSSLEQATNAEVRELYKQQATIYRVERIIYDVVNEIYSLLIVYQEYVNVLDKRRDNRS